MSEVNQTVSAQALAWARSHRFLVKSVAHLGLFALSWLLAFGLAYNFRKFEDWFGVFFLQLLPVILIVKTLVFNSLGLQRGSWRYVSIRDFLQITNASWLSFVWVFVIFYGVLNFQFVARSITGNQNFQFDPFHGNDFPDSVLLLDFAATIAMVSGVRMLVRLYHEEVQPVSDVSTPKLVILGAGNAGENVAREVLRQPLMQYRIVGFLDDNPTKWGGQIHGIDVLGGIDRVKEVCEEHGVDEVLIAMPSATRQQIRRVVAMCEGANVRFKTLPALTDLIAGRAKVQQIRDVDINDLLGRAPVTLDEDKIAGFLLDRVVMVTGAGGSIGSEMCRQIARYNPKRVLLVEQFEGSLFNIERELHRSFGGVDFVPFVADICDALRMEWIFKHERPSAVFHAAAHKHVPMMEHNPGEAFKNNIRGTQTVAEIASRCGCEKFVMISTDKAVNPTSVMGASKRVAEMVIQALNERVETEFITVRFGNVLGSSGSVVPIFKEQIANGGPVTVTHPDMVRFFMTIPEAAQLVLQAASMGGGGEIYVLDMGEPVKIVDLARDLITLSGFRPGEDIEIQFTGMRPGEKLYEELSIAGEGMAPTRHPKVYIWQHRPENWEGLSGVVQSLLRDANELTREKARARLKEIVPEFHLESPRPSGATADITPPPAAAASVAPV